MNAQVNALVRRAARWLEWDRMVNNWCLANGGCQEVPCGCGDKFVHPRDQQGDEVKLIPLDAAGRKAQRKADKLRKAARKNGGAPVLRVVTGGQP